MATIAVGINVHSDEAVVEAGRDLGGRRHFVIDLGTYVADHLTKVCGNLGPVRTDVLV